MAAKVLPVAAIVGVGPGISRSVAIRFAKEGYNVALMARTESKLQAIQSEIESQGGKAFSFQTDVSDTNSIVKSFNQIKEKMGHPEVLVYNSGVFKMGSIMDCVPSEFEQMWKTCCLGGLVASQQVIPEMVKNQKGTILFTGATAALRGGAKFASFAVSKFGVRALSQSIAREYGPQGIHAAHIIVDGNVAPNEDPNPKTKLSPDAIADTYWFLHNQHPSAWTQEMDLRPSGEKF